MKNEALDDMIEKSFRIEPDFHLPVDFAQKVTQTIARREQWKTDMGEYLSLLTIFMVLLLVAGGLYYYLDKAFVIRVFSFVTENFIPVALGVFLLNFILFADKVLLRLLFTRWNRRLNHRLN